MALEQKLDHVAEGQGQLITQFRRKPNLEALLGTYLTQIQEIEDALFQLLCIPTDISAQVGAQLDLLGKIVGQPRAGRIDATYLRWILARMAINRASGLPDELLTVMGLVAPDNDHELEEFFPAAIVMRILGDFTGDAAAIADLLQEVRAAGVGAGLEHNTEDDADMFTFADGDVEQADTRRGFADDENMLLDGGFDAWTLDDLDEWYEHNEGVTGNITEVGTGVGGGGGGAGCCNLKTTGAAGDLFVAQNVATIIGHTYLLEVVISYLPAGTARIWDRYSADFDEVASAPGTVSITFTATDVFVIPTIGRNTLMAAMDVTCDSMTLTELSTGGVFADVEEI